jgi:hypothetical protein
MNMRPGPNNNNNNNNQSSHQSQDQVFNIHRTIDSNGPDVKIRGNAHHIYEKYLQLARDANSSGDRVMAENYLQHAEHYYRLIMAYQTHLQQQQGQGGSQPYGNPGQASQSGQQPSQAGHYGGPYRNQSQGSGASEPNGNVYDQSNGNANGNGDGNGNGNGEAIVTSTIAAASSQDDVYSEEDNGRYD